MIELTHRKFREAKFFYACLVVFALSERVSAGRSVTLALQREEKDKYDAWFNDWKRDKCTENERELMDHMVRQRNEALKRGEAETELSEEFIPVVDLRDDSHARQRGFPRIQSLARARDGERGFGVGSGECQAFCH